ncbi:MAG: DotI/IcmL family type IV secretion protein [Bdellovibrionales bacterium]
MAESSLPPLPEEPPAKDASSKVSVGLGLKHAPWLTRITGFLRDDPLTEKDPVEPKAERIRFKKIISRVQRHMYIVLGLVFLNVLLAPLLRPTYQYIRLADDKKETPMFSLLEPNQTDQAVLSWAATGITEIMTFGFGDFDQRILAQRKRFTDQGWQSFLDALIEQKMREGFKMRQLVLTTVPTDAPVIVSKGMEEDDEYNGEEKTYKWVVEMPVIMTYTTNNNVSSANKGIVRLTIVRVSGKQNPTGIGIKAWKFM